MIVFNGATEDLLLPKLHEIVNIRSYAIVLLMGVKTFSDTIIFY